jgi:3-hydroxypropanoate dehydrogenase
MVMHDDRLDVFLRKARTCTCWLDQPVDDALLRQVYDLAKLGPPAAHVCQTRIVFVKSRAAKERLRPTLDRGAAAEAMAAPVTAILGIDVRFPELLPEAFAGTDARAWFKDLPDDVLKSVALRSTSLQCVYLMLAARALGLDCGPQSGFDAARVDAEFFSGTTVKSDFMCNLGYGDGARLRPRVPRLDFDQACQIV